MTSQASGVAPGNSATAALAAPPADGAAPVVPIDEADDDTSSTASMIWPCTPNLPQPLHVGPLLSTADHVPPHETTYLLPPPAAAAFCLPPMWPLSLPRTRPSGGRPRLPRSCRLGLRWALPLGVRRWNSAGSVTIAPCAQTDMLAPVLGVVPNHGVATFREMATAGAPASHRCPRPTVVGHTRALTWPTTDDPPPEFLISPAGDRIRRTRGPSRLAPVARDPDLECSGSPQDDYTAVALGHLFDLLSGTGGGTGRRGPPPPPRWNPHNMWRWACHALACVRPPQTLVSEEAEASTAAVGRRWKCRRRVTVIRRSRHGQRAAAS